MSAAASSAAAPRPVRWGILSCGKISHDYVNAIRHLPDVEVVACAARSLSDAQAFAKMFNIPAAYGSYAELVADPNVEIVYIGTLHPQHAENSILALEAGKHVLCEKPFAVTERDGAKVVALAQKKKLFLMEAMWARFQPAQVAVRRLISEGVIGAPKMVQASFGFRMDPTTPRLWENKHAGGATLDLGVYPLALASMVFSEGGSREPVQISAVGDLSEGERVDTHLAITVKYGPGQLAVLNCSFLANLPNEAFICGDKGWIKIEAVNSWHCAQRISYKRESDEKATTLDFPEPRRPDQREFKFGDSQLMQHECVEVQRCLRAGETQSPIYTQKETLHIARLMDEVRRQVGVVYAEDKKQ